MTQEQRGLAAAISAVTIFGLSVGESGPLLSLILDARGTNPVLTGLNAGCTFIGVILGPLIAARAIGIVDIRAFLLCGFALDIVGFLSMRAFPGLGAWFALRMALGVIGSGIFTASEIWINRLARDATRGRVMGIYAAALGAGFGLGPLILGATGIAGWAPFVANAAITAAAMLPLVAAGPAGRAERGSAGNPLAMFRRAPLLLAVVALFGFFETNVQALLPLWGVRIGLAPARAAWTVSAVYVGAVALQVPLGMVSDKAGRIGALCLCGAVGLVGAALMPLAAGALPALFGLLFVWGGIASGIYPVALGIVGDRFRGSELVGINAALVMAYGLGSLAGPFMGGAAMDAWTPHGLPALLAAVFAVLLAVLTRRRRLAP